MSKKTRHYCVVCRRKRNQDKFVEIRLPYTYTRIWVCKSCYHVDRDDLHVIRH